MRTKSIAALILLTATVLVGCRSLPVTGLGNGVYVAVDSYQPYAIEYANKFCHKNGKHIAVAANDVRSASLQPAISFRNSSGEAQENSQSSLSVGGGETYAFKFTCE